MSYHTTLLSANASAAISANVFAESHRWNDTYTLCKLLSGNVSINCSITSLIVELDQGLRRICHKYFQE